MRGVLILPTLVLGCGNLFSGYGQYCEEYIDCLDGNLEDEKACVLEAQEAERVAKVYGCSDELNDYVDCMMEDARCESMGPVDYWTSDGDCDDDYADYLDCLADESDLLGSSSGSGVDTGGWNQWDNGGSGSGSGSGSGDGNGSGDDDNADEPIRDSCLFGAEVCIEPNEPDNASWCISNGGNYQANECPGTYQGFCALPGTGSYTAEATAYYYDGIDGARACESAGGTYTAA